MIEQGNSLSKLAAKMRTTELYEKIERNKSRHHRDRIDSDLAKEEILDLSEKYQVLTEETAFIGVVKQNNKIV